MSGERVDVRVLGAFHLVEASTLERIDRDLPVDVQAGVVLGKNRSGDYVIWQATGLQSITDNFEEQLQRPPVDEAIPLESIAIQFDIDDPLREYLPRQASIRLPRDARLSNSQQASSLFRSADVRMYPSPAGRVRRQSAIARVTVRNSQSRAPLAGALIRVIFDNAEAGRGLTGEHGEALVVAPAIPGSRGVKIERQFW